MFFMKIFQGKNAPFGRLKIKPRWFASVVFSALGLIRREFDKNQPEIISRRPSEFFVVNKLIEIRCAL